MPTPRLLIERLNSIANALEQTGAALALLGLGSVGVEMERLDEFSDLDFFVVVMPGHKESFLKDLSWLESCGELGFTFRNTVDGFKYLYQDGVFCEFAIFEPQELSRIPFSEGRIIWSVPDFDLELVKPKSQSGRYQRSNDREWLLGEALTNLYVGLCRYNRGEKLSGLRFVENYALDRLLDLVELQSGSNQIPADQFSPERRLETRRPELGDAIADFCGGYRKVKESALAQLQWLEINYDVNGAMAKEIRRLASL